MKAITKSCLILLSLFLPALLAAQSNPFDTLKYDKIVAYEFQGLGGRLIKHCLKNEPDRISKSIVISKKKMKAFEGILIDNSSYGNTVAACFDPHLAIVYYDGGDIAGTIDICLDCNYLEASVEIPATSHKVIKVSEDYSYAAHGFSKKARKAIDDFCRSLGFERYLKPLNSIYDQ